MDHLHGVFSTLKRDVAPCLVELKLVTSIIEIIHKKLSSRLRDNLTEP